ncbi:hypothetical protein J2847_005891 [Azospirillum agricola]|uniref:hypothetical protein n=1 Tax=Azospirillum agricola TaxID=1720247 RepID=UPI001AE8A59D|nr:hypothetical protein [Azospirillum agricola]MBP2232562.1 hypothetical protein [Azospirillum agricola]
MHIAARISLALTAVSGVLVAASGRAEQAGGEVEKIDTFLAAFVYLIRAMQAGGPWVLALGLLCIGANIAWLIYWSPQIARPIGAAISMARGGRSEREDQLEQELVEARREISNLRGQMKILEDRDEELRRGVGALVEVLEGQLKRSGMDTGLLDLVRQTLMHDSAPPRLDPVSGSVQVAHP